MGFWTNATAEFFCVKDMYGIEPYDKEAELSIEIDENMDLWPAHYYNENHHTYDVKVTIAIEESGRCGDIMSWFAKQSQYAACSKLVTYDTFNRFVVENLPHLSEELDSCTQDWVELYFDTYREEKRDWIELANRLAGNHCDASDHIN